MKIVRLRGIFWLAIASAVVLAAPRAAWAHFIWLRVESTDESGVSTIQAFFNEEPEPDASFVNYVRDIDVTVDGRVVPSQVSEDARTARWVGKPPAIVNAERDLGVSTRGEARYRLYYTARAQTEAVAGRTKEAGDKLRVRLIERDGKPTIEARFNGEPVAEARVKLYHEDGETTELTTDKRGRLEVEGFGDQILGLWVNHVDPTPGELDGKLYSETRHYATLTFTPAETVLGGKPALEATTFATFPDPAVNSFGGAVLGKWLYVYGGHVGETHQYDANTTAKHFRRLNLEDKTTWEDLPMGPDLQGLALVSDGEFLYRVGGMVAKNQPGEPNDLHSTAEFARFDPETKTWTDLTPLPEPRSTHDAFVLGRTLYVVGGWNMNGEIEDSVFLDTAAAFDLDNPEAGWRTIPQPFQRRALSIIPHDGKLYVLGGLVGGGMTVDRSVDIYDPVSGEWSKGPDLAGEGRTEGFGTSAFDIDGRLYYSGSSGRIFRLGDANDAWEAVGAWALPRLTHRLLPGPGNTILAVGGASGAMHQIAVIEAVPINPEPATPKTAATIGSTP